MDDESLILVLPYPHKISVNNIWHKNKTGVYLNPAVKNFKKMVYLECLNKKKFESQPLKLHIKMFPPDKRKRDIDNVLKIILDSLQFANVYYDDSQIVKLYIEKCEIVENGMIVVKIKPTRKLK